MSTIRLRRVHALLSCDNLHEHESGVRWINQVVGTFWVIVDANMLPDVSDSSACSPQPIRTTERQYKEGAKTMHVSKAVMRSHVYEK